MERGGLFHSVLFRILRHEAILNLSLIPKNFESGVLILIRKFLISNRKITERSVPSRSIPFRVLVTIVSLGEGGGQLPPWTQCAQAPSPLEFKIGISILQVQGIQGA